MDSPYCEHPGWARWIVRHRGWLLATAALLATACYLFTPRLTYDRSIESMFAPRSPRLLDYQKLARTFGGNEVVLLVYHEPQLWQASGGWLERMAQARRRVERLEGVQSVLSLDRLLEAAPGPRDRLMVRLRELFAGLTHGWKGESVALVCMLDPNLGSGLKRQRTVEQLAAVASHLPEGAIAGEPVMISEGFRLVEKDADRLTLYAGLLLAGTIWLCFRTLRWVVIPALVVAMSILLTHAVLAMFRLQLSMVSSMLMAVVMVIAVATLMHVAVRYQQQLQGGHLPGDALGSTVDQLGRPVMWTCLTDAAGFGALTTASVGPVRDFGLMLAIGSMGVLVSTVLIVPAATTILARPIRKPKPPSRLGDWMADLPPWLLAHRWSIFSAALVLALVAGWGCRYLRIESDFTQNFRSRSELVRSYIRVERELGGAGVLDLMVPAPESLNWDYVQRVLRLEQQLREELGASPLDGRPAGGLTKVISLADAVVVMSPVDLRRVPRLLRGPTLTTGLKLMQRELPDFYHALYGRDPATGRHYFRIMLRTWERQPADAKTALIERVQQIARQQFPEAQVSGYFVLLTELIRSLLSDQWTTFAVALAAILVMMWIAFRRPWWAVVALLPNVVPILLVLGGLGWMSQTLEPGWRVNMGVAMIAAVSAGLSVDGSVHYLSAYRRRRQDSGAPHLEALRDAHRQVGRALGLATLSLIVGFAVLCTSEFMPTVYFGALASLTMAGGTAGNLIFLPLLLPARQA